MWSDGLRWWDAFLCNGQRELLLIKSRPSRESAYAALGVNRGSVQTLTRLSPPPRLHCAEDTHFARKSPPSPHRLIPSWFLLMELGHPKDAAALTRKSSERGSGAPGCRLLLSGCLARASGFISDPQYLHLQTGKILSCLSYLYGLL